MRNDKLGRQPHGAGETLYASGQSGSEVRGDGNGGVLDRGYYYFVDGAGTFGPYTTRQSAAHWGPLWAEKEARRNG